MTRNRAGQRLTPRQGRFVEEYLVDSNATQAAIRAGYSARTANQSGPHLLVNVGIRAAIAAARAPVLAAAQVTLESHLKALADLRDKAVTEKQFGAAVSAEVSRGKAAGLYVAQFRDVTTMTDEELEAIVAGRGRRPLRLA